jgi:hypothetical protein
MAVCVAGVGGFNYGHGEAAIGAGGEMPEWYGAAGDVV